MHDQPQIIFVYNADGTFLAPLIDGLYKVLLPKTYPCRLCLLTYGVFTIKKEWRKFLKNLEAEVTFLHRNEFREQYPENKAALPTVLLRKEGSFQSFLSREEINACDTLEALIALVRNKLNVLS